MSLAGQNVQPTRYTVVPRTLVFLTRPGAVLLLRIPPGRGAWSGLYNGVGGHLEQGEDPLRGAAREVREETGLTPYRLRLCGVVLVDTGSRPGIGLYVFRGRARGAAAPAGPEGAAAWVPVEALDGLPLVEDLPTLLPRVLKQRAGAPPFCAVYRYDPAGALQIEFAEGGKPDYEPGSR